MSEFCDHHKGGGSSTKGGGGECELALVRITEACADYKTIMLFFYIDDIVGLEEQHFELGIGTITSEVYSLRQTKHVIYSFGINGYLQARINVTAYMFISLVSV